MFRFASHLRAGNRVAVLGLIASLAALAVTTSPADARRHGKASIAHRAKASSYNPPYAAIIVDANSGKTLHESSPDGLRHPASLTKIMTLYMLFERLEARKISLSTPLSVSARAAAMAPSKLDLKAGETIRVEDAIKAVVTKSANDVAAVIAENLGGDETSFAKMMTRKARMLGMRSTVYRNASGLPNDEQITSARDQAILGRAIQDRFPKYYSYFSTTSFTFKGREIHGHNRLVDGMEGVDGIKTGYVAASGFNLVTSLRRGGRHLVGVVMGGRTARARDARMRELLTAHLVSAAIKRTAPPITEMAESAAPVVVASAAETAPTAISARQTVDTESADSGAATISGPLPLTAPAPGSTDDLKPIAVKTLKVKSSTLQTNPIGSPAAQAAATQPAPAQPQETAALREESMTVASAAPVAPMAAAPAANTGGSAPVLMSISAPAAVTAAQRGWMIQVGALESQKDADERISNARTKARSILARAKAFTEQIVKKDMKLFRARFSGMSKDDAEAACKTLQTAKIVCIALRN